MMGLTTIDFISLTVNTVMLIVGGFYDKKFRQLPVLYVLIFGVIAFAFMTYRLAVAPDDVKTVVMISSVVVMGLIGGTIMVALLTKMIGSGDILVIVLSFVMSPYVPRIVSGRAPLPLLIPLSVILGILAIYSRYRRETVKVKSFPMEFRRVVSKRAGELKEMNPLSYYPVYISGRGFVYEKVFSSDDPMAESKKILGDVPDMAVVYAVPSYPFVFYYAVGFILSIVAMLALDLMMTALGV